MTALILPGVGFDRFVSLVWMDKALDIAYAGGSIADLRIWLADRIEGEAALKKTLTVLSAVWLRSTPETRILHDEALRMLPEVSVGERIVLHWGMTLATYPLFRITASAMGRLLRLQGEFKSQDIRDRVLEHYGSIGTVPRAVNRVVQSVKDWGAIEHSNQHYVSSNSHVLQNQALVAWLLEVCIATSSMDHWGLTDLLQATELFPFDFGSSGHLVVHRSDRFMVTREGLDREIVLLKSRYLGLF